MTLGSWYRRDVASAAGGRTARFNVPVPHRTHIIGAVSSNRDERNIGVYERPCADE
jgi:hypothetical protein